MTLDYDPERIVECEAGAEALQWEAAERIYAGTQIKPQRAVAQEIGKDHKHVCRCAKVWREFGDLGPQDRPPFNEAYQAAKGKREKTDPEPDEPKTPDEKLADISKRGGKLAQELWELSTANPDMTDEIIWHAERIAKLITDTIEPLELRGETHARSSGHRPGYIQAVP